MELPPSLSNPDAQIIEKLVRTGVIVDHEERKALEGEYVAYRLIDEYRSMVQQAWSKNSLFGVLRSDGNRDVAIGFLLETYFLVRSAQWTAVPALSHALSNEQRALLEDFYFEEKGHAESLRLAFSHIGIDPAILKVALPAPETEALSRHFYSCAQMSIAAFSASLIVPEVGELPNGVTWNGATPKSLIDRLVEVQKLPNELIEPFRHHESENDNLSHAELPVRLLSECGFFSRSQVKDLMRVMYYTVEAYHLYFSGILRRYRDGEGLAPLTTELSVWF